MNVALRELIDSDVEPLHRFQSDPRVTSMAVVSPRSRSEFEAHLAKLRVDASVCFRVIVVDGEVAGTMGSFDRGTRQVGYLLGPPFWGRGVATKALALLLQIDLKRPLHGEVATTNMGSRRVLEKCGFVFEKTEVEPDGVQIEVLRLS